MLVLRRLHVIEIQVCLPEEGQMIAGNAKIKEIYIGIQRR